MPKQTNDFQQLIAMVVELLEDGAVVEESREFPDPDTGVMREVDVYALIRGKATEGRSPSRSSAWTAPGRWTLRGSKACSASTASCRSQM